MSDGLGFVSTIKSLYKQGITTLKNWSLIDSTGKNNYTYICQITRSKNQKDIDACIKAQKQKYIKQIREPPQATSATHAYRGRRLKSI